ncbi:uncharacterized protein F5891DRAFT_976985 [Suillus fuscotomentosus]|uniref:Uncharacterized protein n=1 Tax=Suillus fuscotomentosus TaxID=1912939 RepID=A0AAD4HQG5_9AGAM|nr:uncharacterized protein F5891DRAFT_976985 [Suillus fuscotomentosus]KAG1904826.1 hypothetical protein F5891DRAFT_976985 [Suillus fuscotomentosus]
MTCSKGSEVSYKNCSEIRHPNCNKTQARVFDQSQTDKDRTWVWRTGKAKKALEVNGWPSDDLDKHTELLEAIKRIKRTHWISHRVHLVSVAVEVDEEEVPQEHSSEQDAPPYLQYDMSPATTMENAIARGIETAPR